MGKVEQVRLFPLGHQSWDSRFRDLVRPFLPEPAKRLIRRITRDGSRRYPLAEPYTVSLLGFTARFWIKNKTDFYRIMAEGFEGQFSKDLIQTISRRGGNFIDIGSAQGYYSLLAAEAGAEVFAIDPDPVSVASIQENISLNPRLRDRIHVFPLALGDREGTACLYFDEEGGCAPSLIKTGVSLDEKKWVVVTRLDTLIDCGRVPIPQVVKIDVEGAEGSVIDGMRETLSSPRRPSDLFLELHPTYLPLFWTSQDEVVETVVGCGYRLAVDPIPRGGELHCHFES